MNDVDFDGFLDRLSALSCSDRHDPADFAWPERLEDDWCFSPELVSLYGTPPWQAMSESQQKRLAFCEAINFFSLNVHGERYLIAEIAKRLYGGGSAALSRYLNHFVAEESAHMLYFAGFCERYGEGLYPDRSVALDEPAEAGLDGLLLFARINLFEEIVDHYNALMARDARLAPVVREIHRIHHREELRHLAFGRRYLRRRVAQLRKDHCSDRLDALAASLAAYRDFVWSQYYSVDAYRDAALDNPQALRRAALQSTAARRHRESVERRRLGFLRELGLR